MEQLRDMINKYDMFLRSDGNIGLRKKPDNLEKLKKLKPKLIEELKRIEEEKRIAGDPREGQLRLSYYNGDWYRVNAIFKTEETGGNIPDWGNNSNIFQNDELNKTTANFYFEKTQEGYVDSDKIAKKLAELFSCTLSTKKEDLEKRFPDLMIVMRSYDNMMQGKGEYVSEIIFPNFEIFEKYVAIAYAETIQKNKAYKAKITAIFQKAKDTGEKQLICKYSVNCDDPDEECNIDLVYEYAMPDGKRKIEKIHTY